MTNCVLCKVELHPGERTVKYGSAEICWKCFRKPKNWDNELHSDHIFTEVELWELEQQSVNWFTCPVGQKLDLRGKFPKAMTDTEASVFLRKNHYELWELGLEFSDAVIHGDFTGAAELLVKIQEVKA